MPRLSGDKAAVFGIHPTMSASPNRERSPGASRRHEKAIAFATAANEGSYLSYRQAVETVTARRAGSR
jgi:hypothetical protein